MSVEEEERSVAEAARLASLRELLPATNAGIYLDTATRGPLPAEAAAAMREADDWELTVGRVWDGRDEDVVQRQDEARAVLAALLGADPAAITIAPTLESAAEIAGRAVGAEPEDVARLVDPDTGAMAAGRDRAAILDVSLAAGAIPLAVADLKAEAVILACDRWLLGPEGTAAAWLADPKSRPAGLALPRTTLLGLARSVGWLEMYVGLEWVYQRSAALAGRLRGALASMPGVELLTPREATAAILTFRLAGWTAAEAADELSRRVHALIRPLPQLEAIRASVAWFNTEVELDRFADAVAELGRHTPASLPRRPQIVVLGER